MLKTRLALELPRINAALNRAEHALPLAAQPVAHHIFAAGGKRLRPLLTVLTAHLLNYREKEVYDLAATLEMLHAATLLHDDVIDNAPLRRGKAAAHTVFSVTETILAGDALLASANALVATFDQPALSRCFSDATRDTCAGEINELHLLHDPTVSLETYLEVVRGKTARLISSACAMGALLASAPADQVAAMASFGEHIGIAFQLVDDAIDFAPEEETGKPRAGDLKEGKLTLPLRYYRESLGHEARAHFDAAFRAASFSAEDYEHIAKEVTAQGFDQKTRRFADEALSTALSALHRLPDAPEKGLLQEMAEYVRERTK